MAELFMKIKENMMVSVSNDHPSIQSGTTLSSNCETLCTNVDENPVTKDNIFEDGRSKNVIINTNKDANYIHNDRNTYLLHNCEILDQNNLSNNISNPEKVNRKREGLSPIFDKASKKFCNIVPKIPITFKESSTETLDSCVTCDNEEKVKQEDDIPNTDLNDVYKGLLSESIDTFPKPEFTRQKLKRLKRKDLEDIILEQVITTLLNDCHLGYQRELCTRLEQNLEYAHKKISQLHREVKDLKRVTHKLADEHSRRKLQLSSPVIIKRSVGIQAEPHYINQDFEDELSSKEVTFIAPSKKSDRRKIAKYKNGTHTKLKSVNQHSETDYENCSDMDDRNCYESLLDDGGDTDEREEIYKQKISQYNNSINKNGTIKNKIPRPTLTAKQKKSSIVLTWNTPQSTCQNIASFRLFSCQNEKLKSKKRWKIVGDVDPMELPMACTLTDFQLERTYHFAVRAINFKGESGPMSKCDTVFMS